MPGKRSTNLRKGDRAEGFGVQMLRSFAAVASVPREEDIGIDVICTLLRPERALQYAEDSFFVQIKSVSVSEILYENDDYTWLCNLLLPIFVARVDLRASKIEIFSMQRVFTRARRYCRGVKVYLGEGDSNSDQDIDFIPLGHPILEWISADEVEPSFHENTYQIMKAWVMHEQKNRLLRQAHRCQELEWTTNEFPRIGTTRIGANDDALRNLLEGIAPFLFPLADSLLGQFCSGRMEVVKPLKSVFELDQLVRMYDVETDPAPTIWLLAIKNLAKSMNEEERKTQLPQILKEWGFPVNE
jgi:hypothetical protein